MTGRVTGDKDRGTGIGTEDRDRGTGEQGEGHRNRGEDRRTRRQGWRDN